MGTDLALLTEKGIPPEYTNDESVEGAEHRLEYVYRSEISCQISKTAMFIYFKEVQVYCLNLAKLTVGPGMKLFPQGLFDCYKFFLM